MHPKMAAVAIPRGPALEDCRWNDNVLDPEGRRGEHSKIYRSKVAAGQPRRGGRGALKDCRQNDKVLDREEGMFRDVHTWPSWGAEGPLDL